jgi:hypothetical protein
VSLTVTPATSTFGDCYLAGQLTPAPDPSELTIPNGLCNIGGAYEAPPTSGGVTVTNGGTADQIDVNGDPAVPADSGTSWALTGHYSLRADEDPAELRGAERETGPEKELRRKKTFRSQFEVEQCAVL